MARKTGAGNMNEALELFLDTISNTFGGVLFIALLVCILIQVTGKGSDLVNQTSAVEARKLQAQLESLESEITLLEGVLEKLLAEIEAQVRRADGRLADLYKKLLEEEKNEKARYIKLTSEATRIKSENAGLAQELKALQDKRDRLKSERDALTSLVNKARSQIDYQIRLPIAHKTEKKPVPVLVAHGRLCLALQYDSNGNQLAQVDSSGKPHALPSNDVVFSVSGDQKLISPKPDGGIKITDTDAFRLQLAQLLGGFDNQQRYVIMAVWPDSYVQTAILRDMLIKMKYDYSLLLMSEGEPVVLAAGAQSPPPL